jgi:hypothetical protein
MIVNSETEPDTSEGREIELQGTDFGDTTS